MDLAKYRALFLEEATEHLAEMSRALLDLEKNPAAGEAVETAFRMAHSTKSMAASLDYGSIAELSHRLEDRLAAARAAGRVVGPDLLLLFRGLEALESMVAAVRATGEPPPADAALLAALGTGEKEPAPAAKKVPSPAAVRRPR